MVEESSECWHELLVPIGYGTTGTERRRRRSNIYSYFLVAWKAKHGRTVTSFFDEGGDWCSWERSGVTVVAMVVSSE